MNMPNNIPSPAWETWKHVRPDWPHRDRYALMQMVTFEASTLRLVDEESSIPKLLGLTVNVSSSGLSLLTDWSPKPGDVVRLHMPISTVAAHTPTLAEVRWVRSLPFEERGLSIVGMRFIV